MHNRGPIRDDQFSDQFSVQFSGPIFRTNFSANFPANFPINFPVNFPANFPGNLNFRPILQPIPRPFPGKYSGKFNFPANFPGQFSEPPAPADLPRARFPLNNDGSIMLRDHIPKTFPDPYFWVPYRVPTRYHDGTQPYRSTDNNNLRAG